MPRLDIHVPFQARFSPTERALARLLLTLVNPLRAALGVPAMTEAEMQTHVQQLYREEVRPQSSGEDG